MLGHGDAKAGMHMDFGILWPPWDLCVLGNSCQDQVSRDMAWTKIAPLPQQLHQKQSKRDKRCAEGNQSRDAFRLLRFFIFCYRNCGRGNPLAAGAAMEISFSFS